MAYLRDSNGYLPGIAWTGIAACISTLALAATLKHYRISVSIKVEPRNKPPPTLAPQQDKPMPKPKPKPKIKPERRVFLCEKGVQFGLPLGQLESGDPEIHEFRNIGRLFSVFFNKRGVPRQGALAPITRARIELNQLIGPAALSGLEAFSNAGKLKAWLQQRGKGAITFPSKVKPPLLLGKSTGLFSTRTPHRPNPIGLTLAKIERVDVAKRTIHVSGIDICNDTPILDLKPFCPSDVVSGDASYAEWIFSNDNLKVEFLEEAAESLKTLVSTQKSSFYSTEKEARMAISEVLCLDVRAVHQGRGGSAHGAHQCIVDGLTIHFHIAQGVCIVQKIEAIN